MKNVLNAKVISFTAAIGVLYGLIGIVAIPYIILAVACAIDFVTGVMCASYRNDKISSYKSLGGILKKGGLLLLPVVACLVDLTLKFASMIVGFSYPLDFVIGAIMIFLLICNECISILENIKDMGVAVPSFLIPLLNNIKSKIHEENEEE